MNLLGIGIVILTLSINITISATKYNVQTREMGAQRQSYIQISKTKGLGHLFSLLP